MHRMHPPGLIAISLSFIAAVSFLIANPRRDGIRHDARTSPSISTAPTGSGEAVRFAATGKARLRGTVLAGNRPCLRILGELIAITSSTSPDADARFERTLLLPPSGRGRIQLAFDTADPAIRESAQRAVVRIESFVAPCWLPAGPIRVRPLGVGTARAHASAYDRSIVLAPGRFDVSTAVHEIAHHLEFTHPGILRAAKGFIARRGKGAPILRLSQLTGILAYEPDEVAVAGNWPQRGGLAYSGKFYGSSLHEATATEAVSTGLERLLRDPRRMFREDADYFLFLLLCLQVE